MLQSSSSGGSSVVTCGQVSSQLVCTASATCWSSSRAATEAASPALAPPQPEQLKQLRREHRIAVVATFAFLDADHYPPVVDIGVEMRDLRYAQAGMDAPSAFVMVGAAWALLLALPAAVVRMSPEILSS